VSFCAISLGLISLLAGAAQGPPLTLDDARALQQKGALREAQKAYEALLPELRSSDPAALGEALNALSKIASAQGQYDSAAARAREAIDVHRALGDGGGEAYAVNLLAVAELYQSHYATALNLLERALALARSAASSSCISGTPPPLHSGQTTIFAPAPACCRVSDSS